MPLTLPQTLPSGLLASSQELSWWWRCRGRSCWWWRCSCWWWRCRGLSSLPACRQHSAPMNTFYLLKHLFSQFPWRPLSCFSYITFSFAEPGWVFFFCYAFLLDYPVLPNNFKYRLYTNISGFDFCPESQVCGSNSQFSIWHLHLEMYWDSWLVNMTTQNSQFSTCPQPTICPARCLLSVHFLRPVLRMHTRSIVFLSSFIQLFSRSWWDL